MYRTNPNPEQRTYAADLTTYDDVQALSLAEATAALATAERELKTLTYRVQVLRERRRKLILGGAR